MSPTIRLLRLRHFSILRQLYLEEALLRATHDNWFVINDGTPAPAVVMGISGKPELLVHEDRVKERNVALIKRFTGGGTVVVDRDTIFTGLIMNVDAVEGLTPYPRPIMRWTEHLFDPVFRRYGDFALREHDYVFDDVKFGGNAQAITKGRFVHHTSFLWDFSPDRMALLKHPAKAPEYRRGRDHTAFITPLKDRLASRADLLDQLSTVLEGAGYWVQETRLEEAEAALGDNKIVGTQLLLPGEYA